MNKRVSPVETSLQIDTSPAEDDIIAAEQSILAAFDASDESVRWDIRIIKIDKAAGNAEEYLFSVTPDELDGVLDRVRDTEGTGHYRMRAYKIQGNTKRVFKAADFRVRAPSKPTPAPERQSEMAVVLAAIQKQNETIVQILQRPQTPVAPAAAVDHWGELQKMVAVMTGLMTALRPPEAASATSLLLEGVKLAQSLDPSDKETNVLDVVKTAFENIGALAKISNVVSPARRIAAPSKTPVKPAQAPTQPQISQPPQAIILDAAAIQSMKPALDYLVAKAKKQSNPEFYAGWITDNWPADMITWAVHQPDLFGVLQTIDPTIVEHREWFTRLIDALQEMVNNGGREHPDDVPRTDTASNFAENTGRSRGGESNLADNEQPDEGW